MQEGVSQAFVQQQGEKVTKKSKFKILIAKLHYSNQHLWDFAQENSRAVAGQNPIPQASQ